MVGTLVRVVSVHHQDVTFNFDSAKVCMTFNLDCAKCVHLPYLVHVSLLAKMY